MAVKEVELTSTQADLKTAKEEEKKAEADLTSTKDAHTQVLANKDKELQILKDAKAREKEVVAEYRRSMDFVHRLANRYNGGWSAAMHCARHALPGMGWEKMEEAHSRRLFELAVEEEQFDF